MKANNMFLSKVVVMVLVSVVVAMVVVECKQTPAPADQSDAQDVVETTRCDGEPTTVPADARGQELADALMDQWKREHPDRNWLEKEKASHSIEPGADNADVLEGAQAEGHAYGKYTEQDLLMWARETEKFVAEGSRIFHSADELESTVGVSCDMCHPDASNTHAETYPKFQVQLGRTVLLRDMINWCIENPVRGAPMEPDDPRMRAMEAYIMAQRRGVKMNYNQH